MLDIHSRDKMIMFVYWLYLSKAYLYLFQICTYCKMTENSSENSDIL